MFPHVSLGVLFLKQMAQNHRVGPPALQPPVSGAGDQGLQVGGVGTVRFANAIASLLCSCPWAVGPCRPRRSRQVDQGVTR